MKICGKCLIKKQLNEFNKDSTKKDGIRTICIICDKQQKKLYRLKTNFNIKVTSQICTKCSIEKSYIEFHKTKMRSSGLMGKCKDCRAIDTKNHYDNNKEKIINKTKEYYYNNREKCTQTKNNYNKKRAKTDVLYRLSRRLRNRLYYALKRQSWTKNTKFQQYLGCSLPELKEHLQKQFKDGMNWDNFGKWHLDHIIPLSSAPTEQDLYKLCHYSNIQPLWAKENLSKANKII